MISPSATITTITTTDTFQIVEREGKPPPSFRDAIALRLPTTTSNNSVFVYSPSKKKGSMYNLTSHGSSDIFSIPIPFTSNQLDPGRKKSKIILIQHKYLFVLIAGGGDPSQHRTIKYDIQTKQLAPRSWPVPPIASRCCDGCVPVASPLHGAIYVVGGRDTNTSLFSDTVEELERGNTTWRERPSLKVPRQDAAAVCHPTRPSITLYVTGGYFFDTETLSNKECPYTEIFDGQQWKFGPSLNVPRRGHSMLFVRNSIIVVGGVQKGNSSDTMDTPVLEIEAWNIDMNAFVVLGKLPETIVGNGRFSSVQGQDRNEIYLIGGGNRYIHKISIFPDALTVNELQFRVPSTPVFVHPLANAIIEEEAIQSITHEAIEASTTEEGDWTSSSHEELGAFPYQIVEGGGYHEQQKWLPKPPALPNLPLSSSIIERQRTLNQFINKVESLQEAYRTRINESTKRITEYYEKVRDEEIESVQLHGTNWLSDTSRIVEEAKEELQLQQDVLNDVMRKKNGGAVTATSVIVPFLKTTDLDDYADGIPSQLRCPLTLDLMKDPVVAADGNTYERSALDSWFEKGKELHKKTNQSKYKPRSPLTGAELSTQSYFPVHTLRTMCEQFAKQRKAND